MLQCLSHARLCNLVVHTEKRTQDTELQRENFLPEPEQFYLWERKGPMETRWGFQC